MYTPKWAVCVELFAETLPRSEPEDDQIGQCSIPVNGHRIMDVSLCRFRLVTPFTFVVSQAVGSRPGANALAAPSKETEKQIRNLRIELSLLKKRLEEMPMQLILPPADGDFAILASRPIMGYK